MTKLAEEHDAKGISPAGEAVAAVVPLSELSPGESGIVRRIDGGRSLSQRLSAMGILPGSVVTVVRRIGPVILKAKGARIVLGKGTVPRIHVERQAVPHGA